MPTVQLVIVCATVLVALGMLSMRVGLPRRRPGVPLVARRVTIHTRKPDDQTIHGLELHANAGRRELVDAHYVTARGDIAIPGTVIVPDANIAWIQDHGAEPLASNEPPAQPVSLKVAADGDSE